MFERIMGLEIIDDKGYQQYREAMIPILKTFGGAFGYDFKIAEVLLSKTNDKINRVFTMEFPNEQAMNEFFSDTEYLKVQRMYFTQSVGSKTVISMHEKKTFI